MRDYKKTKLLNIDGIECKVLFNYVKNGYGMMPLNCWWGIVVTDNLSWAYPLRPEVNTLDEACEIIRPVFAKVVERYRAKHSTD